MNGPIRKVSAVVMVMFLALLVNVSFSYVARTDQPAAGSASASA